MRKTEMAEQQFRFAESRALEFDAETGSAQTVDLPAERLAIHARSVWTRRLESGKSWSGVEVDDTDPVVIDAWRRFVDKN